MRNLIFVLTLILSSGALAAESVIGLLEKEANEYYLRLVKDQPRFKIVTTSADAQESLKKLSSGDFVTGTGEIKAETLEISLESIDYVGIKKLIGTWHSQDGMFEITSFDHMNFYPYVYNPKKATKQFRINISKAQEYKYSMTPTQGREWVLFLSDTKSTTFATIQINQGSARLKMYDSETGDITKSLRLTKWRDR